jgi:hypothetical protein
LEEAVMVRNQLVRILGNAGIPLTTTRDKEAIQKCAVAGLVGNLMKSDGGWYQRISDNISGFTVARESELAKSLPSYLVASDIIKIGRLHF